MKKSLGRPKSNKELRVSFSCMVKPATRDILDAWIDSRGISIDKLVKAESERLGELK